MPLFEVVCIECHNKETVLVHHSEIHKIHCAICGSPTQQLVSPIAKTPERWK
jgi:ribosomal protein S27E